MVAGIITNENFLTGISAGSLAAFTRPKSEEDMGWSRAEVEVLLAGVRADLRNTDIHAYLRVYVKPSFPGLEPGHGLDTNTRYFPVGRSTLRSRSNCGAGQLRSDGGP